MFPTYQDFRQAQKKFNTDLIEALHLGMEKKYSQAGNKLDKIMNSEFPGMLIEEIIQNLQTVRENCRNLPKDASSNDVLKKKFEEIYGQMTGNKATIDV